MKLRTYSSLAAFIAHYAALRAANIAGVRAVRADAPVAGEAATLSEMEGLIDELSAADRAVLRDQASQPISSGAAGRHRARAEIKLHRLLTARGLLVG